jgi:hypothetical protein
VNFPYVATFQQHLHMEYISLSWYNIPELVLSLRMFFGRLHDLVHRYGIAV